MRVLFSGTIETNAGGVATCVYTMLKGLREYQHCEAELIAYQPLDGISEIGDDIPVHYTPRVKGGKWNKLNYSAEYKRDILLLSDYDIYHANGVWLYDTYGIIDAAKIKKRPYVIMPHGMLYPQDIAKSNAAVKKFFLKYRLLKDLNHAACIQTTCEEERRYCRELGVKAPIAVIPNPIEITDFPEKSFSDSKMCIGYIGRVSRRKNIEGLIYAWAELSKRMSTMSGKFRSYDESKLMIIGGGDSEYENFLKSEVERLQLRNVVFTGMLAGSKKEQMLQQIDVLVMPSEFENFGMVVVEGLIRGIPCIATTGSPWTDLNKIQCGWCVPYTQEAINDAVNKAFVTPGNQLSQMGKRGKDLVKNKYSAKAVSEKMALMYNWILTQTDKPDFIEVL